MKDHKEEGSVSDQLDALLLSILKEVKEYEENKLKFMEIYRDVPSVLLTSRLGNVRSDDIGYQARKRFGIPLHR